MSVICRLLPDETKEPHSIFHPRAQYFSLRRPYFRYLHNPTFQELLGFMIRADFEFSQKQSSQTSITNNGLLSNTLYKWFLMFVLEFFSINGGCVGQKVLSKCLLLKCLRLRSWGIQSPGLKTDIVRMLVCVTYMP